MTEPCLNCGTYHTAINGLLQLCLTCGDDETEPVDPEEVP